MTKKKFSKLMLKYRLLVALSITLILIISIVTLALHQNHSKAKTSSLIISKSAELTIRAHNQNFGNRLNRTTNKQPAHDYVIPPVQNGIVPVIYGIPTKLPVIFLTIDDGIYKEPGDLAIMKAYKLKASFFLVQRFISDEPSFFTTLSTQTGSLIEDHSYDHYLQTNLSLAQQTQDICSDADYIIQISGRRPVLFRPPGGDYNVETQEAAASCGMKALVMWDVVLDNGIFQYQYAGDKLHPGDIVLIHFSTTFSEDIAAFVAAAKAQGLQFDLLENWLPSN